MNLVMRRGASWALLALLMGASVIASQAAPREESLPWQRHDDRRSERHEERRTERRDSDLVVCESRGRKHHFCRVDTRGRVRLERQLSHTDCVRGETWGLDDRGIWVDDGCRGEFRIERRRHYDEYRHERYRDDYREDRIIRCESRHREEIHCRVDASGEVRLIDQLSRRECRRGDTWGTDRHGIWVREGCRAKFRVGHRRH